MAGAVSQRLEVHTVCDPVVECLSDVWHGALNTLGGISFAYEGMQERVLSHWGELPGNFEAEFATREEAFEQLSQNWVNSLHQEVDGDSGESSPTTYTLSKRAVAYDLAVASETATAVGRATSIYVAKGVEALGRILSFAAAFFTGELQDDLLNSEENPILSALIIAPVKVLTTAMLFTYRVAIRTLLLGKVCAEYLAAYIAQMVQADKGAALEESPTDAHASIGEQIGEEHNTNGQGRAADPTQRVLLGEDGEPVARFDVPPEGGTDEVGSINGAQGGPKLEELSSDDEGEGTSARHGEVQGSGSDQDVQEQDVGPSTNGSVTPPKTPTQGGTPGTGSKPSPLQRLGSGLKAAGQFGVTVLRMALTEPFDRDTDDESSVVSDGGRQSVTSEKGEESSGSEWN